MRPLIRRGVRALALVTALAGCAPLIATPAHAEDPVTTAVELGEDSTALVTDSVADLARGCTPIVSSWDPVGVTFEPFIRNNSTYYRFTGGGTAHLNCSATYKIQTILSDTAPAPWNLRRGPWARSVQTTKNPSLSGVVEVPYVGPDAPVLRPAGQLTVHVEIYKRLSTTRYAKVYNGCNEWHYIVQPTVPLTVTDPTQQSACAYDGVHVLLDTAEASGVQVVEADSAEALAG